MALKKAITIKGFPEMVDAYHKIVHYDSNAIDNILSVEIAIYYNQATRMDNPQNFLNGKSRTIKIINWLDRGTEEEPTTPPVVRNDFNDHFMQTMADLGGIIGTTTIKDVIYKALYTWIKANDVFFSDAEDV